METKSRYTWNSHERGAALLTGLIFLVLLTILGLSTTKHAIQQELIARNLRDQDRAFQAAEAALIGVEHCIRANAGIAENCGRIDSVIGGYDEDVLREKDKDWWTDDGNTNPYSTITSDLDASNHSIQPRYVIALFADEANSLEVNNQYSTKFYQITAIGFGINENAQKVLQSIFVF